MFGKDIASKVPAPDKLKGYPMPKGGDEPESDAEEGAESPDDEAAENEAAGVSMMQEAMDAFKGGDAAEACRALDAYLEARGFVKK